MILPRDDTDRPILPPVGARSGVPMRDRLRFMDDPPCPNPDCEGGEVMDDDLGATAVCGDCDGRGYLDGRDW